MKHIIPLVVLVICFIATINGYTEEAAYRLDSIVVTASRTESSLRDAPANITVISREDMESEGAQSLADVFGREPNVFTNQILNNPKFSTIDIRGYGETAPQNALFLIDGRRINSIDNSGPDLSQIPVDMIERVEIYRGAASVLYGDNAAAGVVNVIMKKGAGKPTARMGFTAGSYDYFKPYLSVSGAEKRFSYYLVSTAVDSGGYRHNNSMASKDLFGNFSLDVLQNLSVGVKAGHHRDNYAMPGDLLRRDLLTGLYGRKDSDEPHNQASTEDNFVDLETKIRLGESAALVLNGSHRNRHTSSHFEGAGWFSDGKSTLETLSFTPKIEVIASLLGKPFTLTAGFDYYTTPTSSDLFGGAWTSNNSSIKKTDQAFYINQKTSLWPNTSLEMGYRVQRAKYTFDYIDYVTPANSYAGTTHEQQEAYRFSGAHTFQRLGTFFFSYAKGFRFPSTDEFVAFDATLFRAFFNPFLKPQTTEEFDFGWRWNPTKRAGGSITFFRAINHDEIYFNPYQANTFFGWIGRNDNYGRTKREGLEGNISLLLTKALRADLSYSYLEAKFDGGIYDGNDIPLVPRNKFTSKLTYIRDDWTFNLAALYTGSRYPVSDLRNGQAKLSGHTTFDASVTYQYRRLKAILAVKNLTGKKYMEYGAFSANKNDVGLYPAPERRFQLAIEYTLGG
jgi:iron complex outermembrane recepter protein